jgi:uncharacterized protein
MFKHGELCWNELATSDSGKAKNFYQKLFGWDLEKSKVTGAMDYDEIKIDEKSVGGIMQMTKDWGDPLPPSHWMNYIAVDDVDATIEKITENGGKVCVPAFDMPNVGRMSVIDDPAGATFSIISFVSE